MCCKYKLLNHIFILFNFINLREVNHRIYLLRNITKIRIYIYKLYAFLLLFNIQLLK